MAGGRFRKIKGPLFFLLILFLSAACGSDGGNDSRTTTAEDTPHVFGTLWAMHYPSVIGGYAADHTYLIAVDEQEIRQEWPCFSLTPGDGEELSNTRTEGQVDLTVAEYMANESPCKWPLSFYLRIGICYQCANRGLYYTSKTVADAQGYGFFVSLYGTYGNDGYDNFSMAKCLREAPAWQGESSQVRLSTLKPEEDLSDLPISTMEIALYEQYFGERGKIHQGVADANILRRDYLGTLFLNFIKLKLSSQLPVTTIEQLQQARNNFLDGKEALERRIESHETSESEQNEEYEILFEALNEQYKTILTPIQYELLFNLDYEAPLDISRFLPD